MACHARILWVDPPVSPVTAALRRSATPYSLRPEISVVTRRITRLTPKAMPGLSRPGMRVTTAALVRLQTRWALRRLGVRPFAVVATYPGDLLGYWGSNVVNVFYGTDDYVAGAELMGLSARYQLRQEIRIVGQADVVAAVSPQLAERWAGLGARPVVIPNGCWPVKAGARAAALPELEDLPQPVIGLIGQLSDRIDLSILNAIADAGFSLLIVGPLDPRWEQQRFKELVDRSHVYYTGPVPAEAVPSIWPPSISGSHRIGIHHSTGHRFAEDARVSWRGCASGQYGHSGGSLVARRPHSRRTGPMGLTVSWCSPAECRRLCQRHSPNRGERQSRCGAG